MQRKELPENAMESAWHEFMKIRAPLLLLPVTLMLSMLKLRSVQNSNLTSVEAVHS